jgi:hypothetical protein
MIRFLQKVSEVAETERVIPVSKVFIGDTSICDVYKRPKHVI